MSAFWNWYVIILTVLFIFGCLWLITWSTRQSPDDVAENETLDHKWDDNIQELNNPAPRWWLYLFYLTIIFAVGYLVAYPGLGRMEGMLGWTQAGQYEAEMQAATERYKSVYDAFKDKDVVALSMDPAAVDLGKSLFANYCSTCHGSDARGATSFPNLTDSDWLYGGSPEMIVASITNGRNGVMPALAAALGGEQGLDNMVAYVRSLSGNEVDAAAAQAAQPLFQAICAACHGADGKGNQLLGSANLTDDIWLHGGTPEAIKQTILNGRMNQMPPHGELLGEQKVLIVAGFIYSLSQSKDSAD